MIEIDLLVLEKKLENVVNVFSLLISPWKKVVALHLNQFEPPYSNQALCHVFFPSKLAYRFIFAISLKTFIKMSVVLHLDEFKLA